MSEARARVRLNLILILTAVFCTVLLVVVALLTRPWEDLGAAGEAGDLSGRAGTSVGRGTVTAVRIADAAEQERVADQLEAATKMVNSFMNVHYEDAEASVEAVRSMATGTFLEQYNAGADDLVEGIKQAKSVRESEVVWAGLVAGDADSATVVLAVEGTVSNKATEFEKQARQDRLQVDLVLEDERWLVNDLQFVATTLGATS